VKGHIGYVIAGEFSIDFNGEKISYKSSTGGIQIRKKFAAVPLSACSVRTGKSDYLTQHELLYIILISIEEHIKTF
jgi:hypothetical protein